MAKFPNVKIADDDQLEQAFFSLAYNKLTSKLKNILPYLVGFQILSKENGGTKGLGVFAFRSSGGQVLLVPCFFIDGKVKELDMLYSKNNEQFYPLNEDFAEMFLQDDIMALGQNSHETRSDILKDMTSGDFRQMTIPPRTGKYTVASVVDYVEDADKQTKVAFASLLEKDAEFCEALSRFYSIEKIAKAISEKTQPKKESVKDVEIVLRKDVARAKGLTEDKKKELMTTGIAVIDNRKEDKKSKWGEVEFINKFSNPTESGVYTYITKFGELRFALILVRPAQLQQHFVTDDSVVIDLDASDKGYAYLTDTKRVFIKDQIKVKDYSEVHKIMIDPAEGKPSYSDTYVLINENLKATQVFRINSNFKDHNGIRRLVVEPYTSHEYTHNNGGPSDRPGSSHGLPRGNYYQHPKKARELTLVMTKRHGDKIEHINDTAYIPSGFKLLKVNLNSYDYSGCCEGGPVPCCSSDAEREENKKHREALKERRMRGVPGSVLDLNNRLKSERVHPMTIKTDGNEYFVSVGEARKRYEGKQSTKIGMVVDLGMDYKQASEIVEGLRADKPKHGYIKLAYTGESYPTPFEEQPYANQLGQPTYQGIGQENMLSPDISYTGNPTMQGLGTMPEVKGIDPTVISQAVQLAQNGQKDIFDTHMITALARYVSVSDKVTEYLPSLIEAMDRLGRILFLLHWETDKFKEMYGRSDLPELVELVTNVFKNIGDLVIFLKKKQPELSINVDKQDVLDA